MSYHHGKQTKLVKTKLGMTIQPYVANLKIDLNFYVCSAVVCIHKTSYHNGKFRKICAMATLTGAERNKLWPQWDSFAKSNMRGKMLSERKIVARSTK